MTWFRRQQPVTANAIEFDGEGVYQIALPDLGYGLVFEDNGDTGYLYVTDPLFSNIEDAVHLYDYGDANQLKKGQKAFVVWSADLKKAGLYYGDQFQAGVDFQKKQAVSRTGFPRNGNPPWSADHTWRDAVVAGLET